ncbi:MAG: hypothetical protein HKM05_01795 [Spirochaetales bacterium]|nr:hypothetical protein [Spirochaetales bacterium]
MNDPRARFFLLVLYTTALSLATSLTTVVSLTVLGASVWVLPRVRASTKAFLKAFIPSALIFGSVTWAFQGAIAFEAVLRLAGLMLGPWAFFQTTEPESIYQVMVWLRVPRSWGFTFSVSRQFLEILTSDLTEIWHTLLTRGLPLDRPLKRWFNLPRFLLPVLVSSFHTAEQLAETLETRGIAQLPQSHPTFHWKKKDSLGTLAGFLLVGFSLWTR